jgi:hypothetical protein
MGVDYLLDGNILLIGVDYLLDWNRLFILCTGSNLRIFDYPSSRSTCSILID